MLSLFNYCFETTCKVSEITCTILSVLVNFTGHFRTFYITLDTVVAHCMSFLMIFDRFRSFLVLVTTEPVTNFNVIAIVLQNPNFKQSQKMEKLPNFLSAFCRF